jgi:hypothetical protein
VSDFNILGRLSKDILVPVRAPEPPPEPEPVREFASEAEAKADLEALLEPWFSLEREVTLWHDNQQLRIDYVAEPKAGVDFPYDCFGVEVKRGNYRDFSRYTQALKQAIDYTNCFVFKPGLRRLAVVFVYPGLSEVHRWAGGVNRLAGQFHVGIIYRDQRRYEPYRDASLPRFEMCGGRLWGPLGGAIKNPPSVEWVGSRGTVRAEPNPRSNGSLVRRF